jgi:hypothetical protein
MIMNTSHDIATVNPKQKAAKKQKKFFTKKTRQTRLAIRTLFVKLAPLHTICLKLCPLPPTTSNALNDSFFTFFFPSKTTLLFTATTNPKTRVRKESTRLFFDSLSLFSDTRRIYSERESCVPRVICTHTYSEITYFLF